MSEPAIAGVADWLPRGAPARLGPDADRLVRSLLDRRTGLVRALLAERVPCAPDVVWAYRALLTDYRRCTGSAAIDDWLTGSAAAWDRPSAVLLALSEAVERYAAGMQGAGARVEWGSERQLGAPAIPLASFAGPSPSEWRLHGDGAMPPDPGRARAWVEGVDLRTGRRALGPACLVLAPYAAAAAEQPLRPVTSAGLAAGADAASTILRAVCELIERDAFMIAFLARIALPELDCATVPDERFARLRSRIMRRGHDVRAWDLTHDLGVPIVLASVGWEDAGGPIRTFGAAADPRPVAAASKALLEAAQATCWLDSAVVGTARSLTADEVAAVDTRLAHKSLGARADYLDSLGWLLDDRARVAPVALATLPDLGADDPGTELARVVGRLSAAGLDAFAFDLTTPDIAVAAGMQVWRVLAPGLQPHTLGPVRCLGGQRLRTVPRHLGFDAPDEQDLNPLPHFCP